MGKIQKAVLEYLREQGHPVLVAEIAHMLYPRDEGADGPPPRAFEVSVRRAVHGLARQGKPSQAKRGTFHGG